MQQRLLRFLAALAAMAGLAVPVQARDVYSGVDVVRIQKAKGIGTRHVDQPGQVARLVDEINEQRRRSWGAYDEPLSACAVKIVLLGSGRQLGVLMLDGDALIEPTGASASRGVASRLSFSDLRELRRNAKQVAGC